MIIVCGNIRYLIKYSFTYSQYEEIDISPFYIPFWNVTSQKYYDTIVSLNSLTDDAKT